MKKTIKVLVLGMLLVTALSMAMVDTNINAMVGWRAAYTKVMNKKEGCNFALVDINGDRILELYVEGFV